MSKQQTTPPHPTPAAPIKGCLIVGGVGILLFLIAPAPVAADDGGFLRQSVQQNLDHTTAEKRHLRTDADAEFARLLVANTWSRTGLGKAGTLFKFKADGTMSCGKRSMLKEWRVKDGIVTMGSGKRWWRFKILADRTGMATTYKGEAIFFEMVEKKPAQPLTD